MNGVAFRALGVADLPQVARWLREDHVQRWWKDPSAPDAVEAKYLPRIHGEEPTEVFVIVWQKRDAGMIQRYRIADYPDWDAAVADAVPIGAAAGIDYLIGEPDLVGRGVGSEAIRAFSAAVFDGYPEIEQIVVTPQAANRASCRVLEKSGYRLLWTGMLESDDPSDAGLSALYTLDRSD